MGLTGRLRIIRERARRRYAQYSALTAEVNPLKINSIRLAIYSAVVNPLKKAKTLEIFLSESKVLFSVFRKRCRTHSTIRIRRVPPPVRNEAKTE